MIIGMNVMIVEKLGNYMKIKAEHKAYHRKIIEEQIKNYEKALISEKKRHKKEMADIKKRLNDYKKFWETNIIPIHDWNQSDEKRVGGKGFYQTEAIYSYDRGTININVLKPESGWVCKFCSKAITRKHCYASDSRFDDIYDCCDCKGAKKHGKPWEELK